MGYWNHVWGHPKGSYDIIRRSKFGHFQVGVLDPSLVPTQMDVIIGKRYLELKFVIENGGQSSASSNPQLNADKDGDHDNGRENRNIGGRDSKRSKNGPENTNSTKEFGAADQKQGESMQEDGTVEEWTEDDMDEDDLLDEEYGDMLMQMPILPANRKLEFRRGKLNKTADNDGGMPTLQEMPNAHVQVSCAKEGGGPSQEVVTP